MALALTIIFWVFVAALASIFLAGALILADVFVFPRWTPWRGFAPLCCLFGHTDDDMDEDEEDVGVCQRCGGVFWPLWKP